MDMYVHISLLFREQNPHATHAHTKLNMSSAG